jgi:hypothetical protein
MSRIRIDATVLRSTLGLFPQWLNVHPRQNAMMKNEKTILCISNRKEVKSSSNDKFLAFEWFSSP